MITVIFENQKFETPPNTKHIGADENGEVHAYFEDSKPKGDPCGFWETLNSDMCVKIGDLNPLALMGFDWSDSLKSIDELVKLG